MLGPVQRQGFSGLLWCFVPGQLGVGPRCKRDECWQTHIILAITSVHFDIWVISANSVFSTCLPHPSLQLC